nr:protein FAM207A isoform X1 [Pogona vitticeps]
MVGKVRNRSRLHHAAPKPQQSRDEGFAAVALTGRAATEKVLFTSNIFAGMKIDPKSLVKNLDANSRSVAVTKDENEKELLSKKEKMKLRKERWLQKIESIKFAKQQQKAEEKRKSTPVTGDMQPLMDALPVLSDLVTVSKFSKQSKILVKKKVPTNFSQMKSAQKGKIIMEELAQFHKTLTNPLFKANPLAVAGEHLSKRLKQEREGESI